MRSFLEAVKDSTILYFRCSLLSISTIISEYVSMPKQESKRRWSNKRTQMTGIKGTASISPNPTSTSNLPHSTHSFSRTISIRFWTGIWKELATVTANLKFLKMNSYKLINNKNSISKTSVDVRDSKLEKNASYQYLFHLFWSLLKHLEVIKDYISIIRNRGFQ